MCSKICLHGNITHRSSSPEFPALQGYYSTLCFVRPLLGGYDSLLYAHDGVIEAVLVDHGGQALEAEVSGQQRVEVHGALGLHEAHAALTALPLSCPHQSAAGTTATTSLAAATTTGHLISEVQPLELGLQDTGEGVEPGSLVQREAVVAGVVPGSTGQRGLRMAVAVRVQRAGPEPAVGEVGVGVGVVRRVAWYPWSHLSGGRQLGLPEGGQMVAVAPLSREGPLGVLPQQGTNGLHHVSFAHQITRDKPMKHKVRNVL